MTVLFFFFLVVVFLVTKSPAGITDVQSVFFFSLSLALLSCLVRYTERTQPAAQQQHYVLFSGKYLFVFFFKFFPSEKIFVWNVIIYI